MKSKLLLAIVMSLLLVILPVSVALAQGSDTVTVTATPSFLGISNSPSAWTLNDITGDGTISENTTYYANPLGDTTAPAGATVATGECYFTITNTSSVPTNVVVNISDFSGGSDPMTNSNAGTAGLTSFGAYSWYDGMTYSSKVVAASSGSSNLYSSLAANTDLNWGMEITTQESEWTGGTSSTATITVTVTEI